MIHGGKTMEPILKLEHIQKYYGNEGNITKAIRDISFSVEAGEFLGIMGASGSGKTTLLNCISTIDTVSAGHIYLGGTDVTEIKPKAIARFRRENLGFVFQDFNLLDTHAKRAMIVNKPYYMNRRDNPNSSVHSREKVYCVNVEYDHIRDILVKDPEIWERFRGVYWLKKYHNYNETIRRIGPEFKKDYIRRYSSEFKRAMEMQEIDQTIFTKLEWANIQFIIKSPDDYYYTRIACTDRERKLEREVRRLRGLVHQTRADLDRVKKTPTFRIGAVIMFIPRKIKSLFSRNK